MPRRSLLLPCLVLALAAGSPPLAGCGGASAGGKTAADSRPPPAEVMQLTLYVPPGGGESDFGGALQNALVQAGFAVVNDRSAAHDVELTPRLSVGPDDSFLQMVKNGERRRKYTARVDVTAQGAVLGQFVVDYTGYGGDPPDEGAVATVVDDFAHSSRVARYARQLKAGPAAATTGGGAPATPSADPTDDRDWFAVDPVKCKVPATLDACDGVRDYLQRHPHGAHASEATRTLTQAVSGLERLRKDENSWQKTGAADCRQKRTRDACIGVEAYETAYPTGLHAEEARRLLGK